MARTISDEQIKLSIIIEGNPAQKELHDAEKSIRDLNKQQIELRKEKQLLEKAGQKESARYREVTQAMRENTAAINVNKSRMEQLQREIGLTGLTMAQLRSKATALRATLNNLIPGSEDYKRFDAELNRVNARISELRGNAQAAGFSLGRLADSVNRYAALGTTILATATGVVLSIQQMLDISGKLSDAQADVQKTTGMTKEEVDDLTKSFGLLQTRTQRMDLLKIAEQGGRIGIAKDEIQDFVRVMDKASVALGDSFTGGAEQVSDELGKIKFLFKETKDVGVENAYLAIGSAINVLGAEGSASEANIANFTKRIGSLADVLKPSVAETMALGAAFEESGIEAEISARAYSIFLKQASTETKKFAQVMGISQEEVEKMINDNPLEFFLKFSKQLSEGAKKGTDMSKVLDQLGLNADGVNKIVGAAGNNVDRFRQLVDMSNKSFNEGTSLIEEYDVKNNNLAATLDKIKKKVMGLIVPEDFVNSLGNAANWFSKFIGATEDSDGKVTAWKNTLSFTAKVIAVVTAAIITNVAWQKLVAMWTTRNTEATLLYNIASKARAFADGVAVVSTQALALAQMLLTGNLKGAAQAFRVMTATMMTTPWGFILGTLAAIGTAYVAFRQEAEKLTAVQKVLNDVHLEAEKSIAGEKAEVDLLVKAVKSETTSKEEKEKALKRLNEIIPDYIGLLTAENIKTLEGKNILDKYTESLYKNARAKAAQAKFEELAKKRLEVESKTTSDYTTTGESIAKFFGQGEGPEFKNKKDVEDYVKKTFGKIDKEAYNSLVKQYIKSSGLNLKESELNDIDAQMKALEDEVLNANINKSNKNTITPDSTSEIDLSGGKGGKEKSSKEKKYDDSYLDQEKRLREELIKLQQKSEDERIAILGEGYAKEMQIQIANFNNKQNAFKQESESIKSLQEQLNKDLIEAQKNGDTKKVASIKNMQQILFDKEKELNKQMQYEEQMHYLKIGTIQEKAGQKQVEKIKSQYDQEKTARETAFLLELESLELSEKEKQKRKEQFAKDELAFEEKMLNDQLNKLNSMLQNVEFDGIIFDLLSEEEKEKLKNDILLVENAIAKLRNAKNNPEGDQKELDLGVSSNTDILGFSQEQWDNFFQNIDNGTVGIQTMQMAISAAQQLWSQFDQYLTASENAQLKKYEKGQDARKRALKRQLDNGQINQVQYKRKVEELDQELDRKKAEVEYKQAKRQRLMSIANVITSTAQAIMSIWAQVPKFDFGATAGILTGMVSAMGALQLGTILKTPLPAKGYEQGLYPEDVVREQDGRKFKAGFGGRTKSGMVTKPTYFLAGENYKPEMVIDNKAYRDLSPYTRNLLINELRGIKGFENGYYNPQAMRIEVPATTTQNTQDNSNDLVVALLSENLSLMKDIKENGMVAFVTNKDMKSMKYLQEGLQKYKELQEKNRK
ncbi:phage tail tape measure protein [Flavobacterium sp. LMO6]|uniref:Tail tape measure protein n=1 Tax=Flavobacterium phage vB_FspS_laban6-1 TaxID=2686250 RepID=A0A6B9LAL4_9CAUD|nr:phage tail tape measure protein [Flavobacterium sp. LMO6]YP_009854803.1 tail length tape measure protein [Flavobacterium phage vB_FspS_laban6-1]MQP63336.1 phage tail tape measure protein [Flavobacterium sp. LMO6]QHB38976.1 tail tape measure protein [Flavobacterium phage vB_FspS_laban6-1]